MSSSSHNLRCVFAGSPEFAASILATLYQSPHRPIAVYTQPDRPKGRGRKLKPNEVKKLATELGLEVLQPKTLRDADAQAQLSALQPDVLIVAAYGLILPPEVLAIPTYGCINVPRLVATSMAGRGAHRTRHDGGG